MKSDNFFHQSDLEFLQQSLKIIKKGKSQAVCLYGDIGIGKTTIIQTFINENEKNIKCLFHFNPVRKEENALDFLYEIFYYLWNQDDEFLNEVKDYFYKHTKDEIKIIEKRNAHSDEQIFKYYHNLIPEILKDFIFIANQHKDLMIVFENMELYTEETLNWLLKLARGINHPIFLILTTTRKKILEKLPPNVQQWTVKSLNVKNAEKFILPLVNNIDINAKIITNYIYLKTGGNPSLIKAIVSLWFSQKSIYKDQIIDSNQVRASSVPLDWDELWEWYFTGITDLRPLLYFYFFNKSGEYKFWKKIFKNYGMHDAFENFLKDGVLVVSSNLGKKILDFYHPSLEEYIRLSVSENIIEEFLVKELDKNFIKKNLGIIRMNPYILSLLSDELPLTSVLKIVEKLNANLQYNEITQILTSYHLLPDFKNVHTSLKKKVYRILAEVYERQNKYENALHYYQLLKDLEKKNELPELEIQLKIAKLLIKMDRIEEASFILKYVLHAPLCSTIMKAEIYYISGDVLYQNSQQEKAIHYFEEGLKILNSENLLNNEIELKGKILMKLAAVYNSIEKYERALKYLNQAQTIFQSLKKYSQSLKISLLKSYLWFRYFPKKDALKKILSEYKNIRHFYAPGVLETIEKQIAELYWLVGKWRYAQAYYNKLFHFFTWRGDIYNACFMLGNMATISKEIGEMGEAIHLEERALRLEHISQNIPAMVYSYMNLGHLYLMIGSYFSAQDQLQKALHLAEKNELFNEVVQTRLLLSFLYLKQKSLDKASNELFEAKEMIDMIDDEWGWVNYLFYKAYLMVEKSNISEAEASLSLFLKRTQHLVKYQCTGNFLQGLIAMKHKKYEKAQDCLKHALDISKRYQMPYWQYQVAYYLALVYDALGKGVESEMLLQESLNAIIKISNSLNDKILETQFLESRDVLRVIDEIKKIPQLNLRFVQWQIEKKNS